MRFILGIFSIVVLALAAFVCNILQVLSLLLYPFSRPLLRKANRLIAFSWWQLCNICTGIICGIEIVYTGDKIPTNEQALLIANHQEMPDIPVILRFARKYGNLGNLKWFAKDILKYIPGIGWGMLFIDCLFVKRNWMADKESVLKIFAKFRKERIPFWIVSFLEGTRITPVKLKRSQDFAVKAGIKPLQHVLLPRTKGFVATMEALDGLYDAVYDLTIGYENGVPSLGAFFYKDVRRVHLHVKRYPVSSIPTGREERAEWTTERYREKDALLDHFYREGFFKA